MQYVKKFALTTKIDHISGEDIVIDVDRERSVTLILGEGRSPSRS
jgi:hypothetical protein